MLNEMPLLRAPENRRTGIEIKPKVRYPDQTEDAIVSPQVRLKAENDLVLIPKNAKMPGSLQAYRSLA